MAGKLLFEPQLTTANDKETIAKAAVAVKTAIESVTSPMNDTREYFLSLAAEINKELKAADIREYNVFLGEKYETAVRYEKNSLIAFKWNNIRVLLLKCQGKPIYTLQDNSEFTVTNINQLREEYLLTKC
eukprot:TRINITY_DN812_c0_g1_i12.p2 TRINITY_DN812_c0_g1~~TRINITY_DN812_c0_g1_i12.p2  ORF type:complete len:130 (-),score=31.30 TRINITY_DN812_c0_g1_i12:658-1047(-)